MALSTQPYKGTRDFYPDDMRLRRWMFGKWREAVEQFGYREYDGPMLESFELYAAKTGEEIVNQQLYWMVDRGERKIAVRPEMTPTMARMVAAKIHELSRPIRLYSIPNLWRYERPQRGRLREHWQLNVDVLGGDLLLADCEILQVALQVADSVGGMKHIRVRVNHREIIDYLFKNKLGLSAETALQVIKALDARDKVGEEAYFAHLQRLGVSAAASEKMEHFFKGSLEDAAKSLPESSGVQHLLGLFEKFAKRGLKDCIEFDPTVMRGMDYYTGMVFEIYDRSPENHRAMFGGGRYDQLIGMFGKENLSGVGFGMGDVTFQNFLETYKLVPDFGPKCDVFMTLPDLRFAEDADQIAAQLRKAGFSVMTPLAASGFGAQLKLAAKHGAGWAVLFGEKEWSEGKVLVKNLVSSTQVEVAVSEIVAVLLREKNK